MNIFRNKQVNVMLDSLSGRNSQLNCVMKINLSKRQALGTVIAIFCLVSGDSWQIANAEEIASSAPPPSSDAIVAAPVPDSVPTLPPNIYPSSPLAQVIRLVQADVSGDVIMTYVTNSGSTFNLDPDKIIYLKDLGAPDELVTAMIQRDQVLHQQMSAYQPPQPAPVPTPVAPPAESEPVPTEPPPEQPEEVTVNNFYYTLAPYGSWVTVNGYGRCWRPTVVAYNSAWQPYCDHGHWIYTDCGWYWASDYSWGWAAFHYGRWFNHPNYGWCWYPGATWGPSWVTWRYANNYCGWAPLPPFTACTAGAGITYHGVSVTADFNFGLAANCFTFVPTKNFCDPHLRHNCIPPAQVTQVFNQTTVINNINVNDHNQTIVNTGIEPQKITSVTRTQIHPLTIRDSATPVAHGEQVGRDGQTLFVNRAHFTGNPNNKIGSPHTAAVQPSTQPMIGSPYLAQNNFGRNNRSWNSDGALQPQHNSQPTPQPKGNWQRAYTYGTPVQNSPTMSNPTAVGHSAPANSVQSAAPNTMNNSADIRWYPTPRMRQFDQQSPHGKSDSTGSGSASADTASQPQAQHASGNAHRDGRTSWQYSSASSQTAFTQSSIQPASLSPASQSSQSVRGWGRNQNSQP
jgi:hypothetical protein